MLVFEPQFFADEVWVDSDAGEINPFVYHAACEKIHEGLDFDVVPIAANVRLVRGHDGSVDDAAGGGEIFEIDDGLFDDGDEERARVRVIEPVG